MRVDANAALRSYIILAAFGSSYAPLSEFPDKIVGCYQI